MATAQQRSLRVRTRAGGEPAAAEQHPETDNNNGDATESDDERSKGKKTKAGAVASSSSSTTTPTPSTWRPGRTLVWLAYLVSWAVYAYVRATRSLDLGAYSWWVVEERERAKEKKKEKETTFLLLDLDSLVFFSPSSPLPFPLSFPLPA